jgi:6-phosphogluconolactonase (cycloisomerase 2 family)
VVGSGSCSSTASTSGHFYILNSSTLAGYTIGSGSMNLISNSSFTLTGASAIAISPSGNFLYVATNNGIIPFTINSSTGALTQGSAFGDTVAGALQVDPSGNWLIDASLAGTLNAYSLSSGAYGGTVQSESLNLGSGSLYPTGIAISPSGYSGADIVAVAMGTTGTGLFTFTSSTTSGPLSAEWSKILSPIGSGSDIAVAIDPQNRLLYVGETNAYTTSGYTGALRVYTIGSTGVTSLNAYAPAGTGPHAILPSKDGSYVYAASWGSDEITGYSVTTSALTAFGSTIATGTEPYGLVEDSTDGYVLGISYGGTPAFDAYTLSSGTLTSLTSNSTVNNPVAIVAVPK